MKKLLLLITTILLTSLFICSCSSKSTAPTVYSGMYFDTFITVTIYDSCDEQILSDLEELIKSYDIMFSLNNEQSFLYQINNSSDEFIECSDEFINVLNTSLKYAEESNGLLDPTVESVKCLWDFTGSNNTIPDKQLISNQLSKVNYKNIIIEDNKVKVLNGSKLNLGYISKGYIADKILEYLKSQNISNVLINLGGNILASGLKNNTDSYSIGIQKPFSDETAYAINTTNTSIVTSGIYERYFELDNKIYHHIIDVNSGYPINNDIYSVTIKGPSSEKCDALSTMLLILGKEKALAYIENEPDYEALIILNDYSIITSSAFPANIQ